jgi:hypothetical protein
VVTENSSKTDLDGSPASQVTTSSNKASPTFSQTSPVPTITTATTVPSVKMPAATSSLQSSPTPSLAFSNIPDTLVQTGTSAQAIVTPTQIYSFPQSSPNSSYNSPPNREEANSPFPPPNQSLLELGTCDDIEQFVNDNQMNIGNDDLVRRHSLSLRSPPLSSLAAEILHSSSDVTPHFAKAKSLLTNLTEMTSHLSDFESCLSSSSSDDDLDENVNDEEGFQTMNGRKRAYKQKRKNSTTPSRESFLKKPNLNSSPPS